MERRPQIDLIDRVVDVLKEYGIQSITKRFDSLVGKSGVCVRRYPSTIIARQFDMTREISWVYEVIVRDRSEEQAMNLCLEIEELLDDRRIPSSNGSYLMVSNEVYTASQELALDEANFYAWHVRLQADLMR